MKKNSIFMILFVLSIITVSAINLIKINANKHRTYSITTVKDIESDLKLIRESLIASYIQKMNNKVEQGRFDSQYLQISNARFNNGIVFLNMTFTDLKADGANISKERASPAIRWYCNESSTFKPLLDLGLTINLSFFSFNKVEKGSITFSKADCKPATPLIS